VVFYCQKVTYDLKEIIGLSGRIDKKPRTVRGMDNGPSIVVLHVFALIIVCSALQGIAWKPQITQALWRGNKQKNGVSHFITLCG
jgi:hypothetical protein